MGTGYHHGTFCQLQCLSSHFSHFLEVAFQAMYWPAHVNAQNMHLFISTFTSLCIICASDELFPIDNMTISVFSQKKKRQYLWTCNFSAKHLSHNPLCLRRKDYGNGTATELYLQETPYLLQPRSWLHESRSSIRGQKESKHQSISAIPVTVANCMTIVTKTWITVGRSELWY